MNEFDQLSVPTAQQPPEADVVFLLDGSRSMYTIIEKVKEGVIGVYNSLSSLNFTLRFKAIAYDWKVFVITDFYEDPKVFSEKLGEILTMIENKELGRDEFTLPALDWALDSEWKYDRRVIIVFTDECLKAGHDPDFQWFGPDKESSEPIVKRLGEKINTLGVRVVFIGPDCPGENDYNVFLTELEKSLPIKIEKKEFASIGTQDLIDLVAKSISSSRAAAQSPPIVEKDLYKISGKIKIRRI